MMVRSDACVIKHNDIVVVIGYDWIVLFLG